MRVTNFRLEDIIAGHDSVSEALLAEDLRDARARIAELERERDALAGQVAALREALVTCDSLFKSLGQVGHDLDKVLDVMCAGREITGPAIADTAAAAAAHDREIAERAYKAGQERMRERMRETLFEKSGDIICFHRLDPEPLPEDMP